MMRGQPDRYITYVVCVSEDAFDIRPELRICIPTAIGVYTGQADVDVGL